MFLSIWYQSLKKKSNIRISLFLLVYTVSFYTSHRWPFLYSPVLICLVENVLKVLGAKNNMISSFLLLKLSNFSLSPAENKVVKQLKWY